MALENANSLMAAVAADAAEARASSFGCELIHMETWASSLTWDQNDWRSRASNKSPVDFWDAHDGMILRWGRAGHMLAVIIYKDAVGVNTLEPPKTPEQSLLDQQLPTSQNSFFVL